MYSVDLRQICYYYLKYGNNDGVNFATPQKKTGPSPEDDEQIQEDP
jgi:hypothetical protein